MGGLLSLSTYGMSLVRLALWGPPKCYNRVVVARAGAACARPMKGGVWPSPTANASVQKGTCSTGASIDRAHHIALTSFLRKHVSVFHRKHISVFRKTFFCLPGKTFFCFLYSN